MRITCLEELEKRKTLQINDIVIFTIKEKEIEYEVYSSFLNTEKKLDAEFLKIFNHITNLESDDNAIIFNVLKVNEKKLTTEIYGYKCGNGDWPESENGDFAALTRLVGELYEIIEKSEKKYTSFSRFEIMEL